MTATCACKNDATHTETETAEATSEVTKESTESEEGVRTFTAEFENAAFTTQTKTEAIPKKDPVKPDPRHADPRARPRRRM